MIRYVKQFKVRSSAMVYSAENVGVFQFEKTDNHLGFTLIGHSKESVHLVHQTDEAKEKLISEVQAMSESGKSQREIAGELKLGVSTVNKYLKKAASNGHEIRFSEGWRQQAWDAWQPK